MRKLLPYIIQGVAVGILIMLAYGYFTGKDLPSIKPVVEFKEAAPVPPASATPASGQASYAAAVEQAAPAVVNVFTSKLVTDRSLPLFEDPLFRRFFEERLPEPQQRTESSLGSGVVVSSEGYILTNNHVIEGADEIQIAFRDGTETVAKVVGSDPETDLAVLKVNAHKLPTVVIGKSDALHVGDVVLAIGNPFGVGQTVTMGIVSATGRSQLGISTFENFIQTDAAINPGNSGGALINAYGQLIGINTAIFSQSGGSQGIGFAIPLSLAKNVMEQIIKYGHAIRGWLGVEVQDITAELAESFGLKNEKGVLIAGVLRGGPADKAGLRAGDIITEVNDEPMINGRTLMNSVAQILPGKRVKLEGVRNNKPFSVETDVGERPKPQLRRQQQ